MLEHPSTRTLDELDQMMKDIQYFLDRPRTQQKRWVEKGATWIPIIERTKKELHSEVEHYAVIGDCRRLSINMVNVSSPRIRNSPA